MIRVFNNLLTIFMAGVLVLGLGGNLWMFVTGRILAGNPNFSFEAFLEIILFGGLVGLVAGSVYLWLIKGRIKRSLMEGTYFGIGTFVFISFLPVGGHLGIQAFDKIYWLPIMLGYSILFWLYGVATVYGVSKNLSFLNFSKS